MALVGNISGSGGVSNTIGITGSLIIANPGLGTFPVFPGSDVSLFVSGNIASKPATSPNLSVRGTTVFGGDVVISGTLFGGSPLYIGTFLSASAGAEIGGTVSFTSTDSPKFNYGLSGSLTKLADGSSYLIAGSNVTIATGSSGAITISSTATGGGASSNFFYDTDGNGQIYTTGSTAFVGSGADYANNIKSPLDKGADLFFYVSGSKESGVDNALFGGRLITSGNLLVKDSSGAASVTLANDGNITVTGNIDTVAAGNKSLFASAGANTITIGGAGSTVAADIASIGGGYGSTGVTLSSDGNVKANGYLQVDGESWLTGSITLAGNSQTVTHTGTGNLTITSTNGSVLIEGSTFAGNNATVPGNLIVNGDLYISGTTTTIDSTVTEIKDPVIGLGYASGSIAGIAGDRGFIGGITGAGNNVAFIWSNSNSSFVATKTTTDAKDAAAPGASVTVSQLQPIRASKFEVGSANAYVTSSNGSILTVNAAASSPTRFSFGGTDFAELLESGVDAKFGAVATKNLVLSGTTSITMVAGANGTVFQRDTSQLGAITGVASTSMTLTARTAASAATSLVLTGSGVTLGANSAVTEFWFASSPRGLASSANGFTLGSQAGVNLNLSGSSNFLMRHGTTGVGFQQHSNPYLTINSGSVPLSANTALITADSGKAMLVGGSSTTIVSGSDVFLDAGVNGVAIRSNSSTFATIASPAPNTVTIAAATSYTTANIVNTVATTVSIGGAALTLNVGSGAGASSTSNFVTGDPGSGQTKTINIGTGGSAGSTTNIAIGSALGSGAVTVYENMLPGSDVTYDLGSPSFRWRNMYTGDLHLRNDRGDWTIIEEREFLSITNNISGRRYKFVLEEI